MIVTAQFDTDLENDRNALNRALGKLGDTAQCETVTQNFGHMLSTLLIEENLKGYSLEERRGIKTVAEMWQRAGGIL